MPPQCPDCGELFSELAKPVVLVEEHRVTVDRAIAVVRNSEGGVSEGRAIELVCADFLSGVEEHRKAEEEQNG